MKKELQNFIDNHFNEKPFVLKHNKKGYLIYYIDPFRCEYIGWTKFRHKATSFPSSKSEPAFFLMMLHKKLLKKLTVII